MSPAENLYLGVPPRARARGNGAVFSWARKSRIRSDRGRSDRKSRAVAFRATVAVSVRRPMRMRIFVPAAWVAPVVAVAAAVALVSAAAPYRGQPKCRGHRHRERNYEDASHDGFTITLSASRSFIAR